MTASFTSGNLVIQTLAEALEERISALAAALAVTPEQAQRWRVVATSVIGNLCRIEAEADVAAQEALFEVFTSLSWNAEGPRLEAVAAILGLEREGVRTATVTGTTDGIATTAIDAGTRLRFNPTGSTWVVATAGAQVPDEITLESETPGIPDTVTIGSSDWTVLESVPGWSDDAAPFTATEQPIVGRPIETDAQLRTRGAQEAYRRGQGPLTALEAAVAGVPGVTFVRGYDNPTDTTDANGIPARSVYVVVEGGGAEAIAAAINTARGAGIYTHGTDIVVTIVAGPNRSVTIRADRVTSTDVWVRATLTTSTSEIEAPSDLVDQAEAALLAYGEASAAIGADVLPRRFAGALDELEGFDAVTLELSLDGVSWSSAKRAMAANERAAFHEDRVLAVLA
jgi:hypothetical protein